MFVKHTQLHASFLIRKLTKQVVADAFTSDDPTKFLKDHARKNWIDLLPPKFMPLVTQVAPLPALAQNLDDFSIPVGVWKESQSGQDVSILTSSQVCKDASGISLMPMTVVTSFLQHKTPISTNALAVLVPKQDETKLSTTFQVTQENVALSHTPTGHNLVFPCWLIQLGQKNIARTLPVSSVTPTPIPSQSVSFTVYKSEHPKDWEDRCAHPVKFLM